MPIYALGEIEPYIDPTAFVHPDAVIIGAVTLGPSASVWATAVLRADFGRIEVGAITSVQDGTIVHTTAEWPTLVGEGCVIGHNAHLEGCVVGNNCLIGSGSIVLNRVEVQTGAGVAAAALVPEDTLVPSGQIAVGVPAVLREAGDLQTWVVEAARHYRELANLYRTNLRRID